MSAALAQQAEPVGVVSSEVKGGVIWYRWPDWMPDGTKLHADLAPRAEPVQAKFDEVAVEQWKLRMVFYDKNGEPLMSRQPEPDEIRAALAQQAEQKENPWRCACGANLYIDENGAPRSKA